MDELIASFRQVVPKSGYRIKNLKEVNFDESKNGDQTFESLIWPIGRDAYTSYEPLIDKPDLFLRFADLGYNPSHELIIDFANHYGWLGEIESMVEPIESNSKSINAHLQQPISAELLTYWFQQLSQFIPYIELWEAILATDQEYLTSVIHWDNNYQLVSYGKLDLTSTLIASTNHDHELLQSFTSGELIRPAKVVLTRSINRNLSRLCNPALLFDDSLSYSSSHLYFTCKNLLGVIWLQFAKAVENNSEYRRCAECSRPFIPLLSERGKKKKFCSNACKSKNYRAKIKAS